MGKKIAEEYFKKVKKIYDGKDYTEMTFRTDFENFIESLNPDYDLIQEPKRIVDLGAPDFKAFLGSRKIGFIETKNIGENLDEILKSEQINKYIISIDNLIITDYCRFILLRKGIPEMDFQLFSISDLNSGTISLTDDKINAMNKFIDLFFTYKLPTIKNAEELAKELSKKAKLLKDITHKQLEEDMGKESEEKILSPIYDFYQGINGLIKDISIEDCADAYAQTVTYSLFLARKNSKKELDKDSAYARIPKNIGIIRRIFTNISADEFPSNISWIIDDIVDILNASDMEKIFESIDKRGKKDKDPILFLYEDFLNFYEPDKKKKMGVYYTPRPVVNFMVKSTHLILKKIFNKPTGFADDTVTVLDPAAGTGTFFWITFLAVLNEIKKQGMSGLISEKIQDHLLQHFYGFEILITPYVIAHLKLADLLQRWHYKFSENDRIQIYLTNTLEPSEDEQTRFSFQREIAYENIATAKIKSKKPIIAIMGNPPYSGISANKGKWMNDLLKKGYKRLDGAKDDGYYKIEGESLRERKLWLQDDYVKFIRFAQWKIDKNGEGVVSFITNHSYLDNPTFRGMRESLLESFDRIYILNLHGNTLKKEKCPDGSKDENVFDIKQGVAIGIFIKNKKFKDKKIFYADQWGLKKEKFEWLDKHTVANVKWQEINPISPFYFFIPHDATLFEEYNTFLKIKDIFPVNGIGLMTARDSLCIQKTPQDMWKVVNHFANLSPEEGRIEYDLGEDSTTWAVKTAQEDLLATGPTKDKIVPILYRPFDIRYTYYTEKSKGFLSRPLYKTMKHMEKDNIGLVIGRQWGAIGSSSYDIVFITDGIMDINFFRRGGELIFPLYTYEGSKKTLNIASSAIKFVHDKYNEKPSPEEIFYYIYAILHSPEYRKKYEPILKYDFPRIPFIDDYEKFRQLSELGNELAEIHLMKKNLPIISKFNVEGSNIVESVLYETGNVWINKKQYFEGVPQDVWDFHIGGYQVLNRFLTDKDRKSKKLTGNEIQTFLQSVVIIKLTMIIMKKIDDLIN